MNYWNRAAMIGAIFIGLFLLAPENLVAQQGYSETLVPEPAGIMIERWVENLEAPWSLVFLSENRALVSERPGRIRLIDNGLLREEPYAVIEVAHTGEGGLMGLALHPDFPREPYLYAMHTYQDQDGLTNRVVRFRDEGSHAVFDRAILEGIPGDRFHNGGRIAFGPDGMLYITTGEVFRGELAQDLDSLGGKILRIDPDGEIPDDNLFPGSPIYAYGNRNPQGLAWHPETGDLFSSEHGPSGEKGWRGHDELNVIIPGGNYGWPEVVGAPGDDRFVDPLVYWEEATPPAGMTFFRGDLYVATLRSQALLRIALQPAGGTYQIEAVERWFAEGSFTGRFGRLRDVVEGPDGHLYVLVSNRDGRGNPQPGDDAIVRLGFQ